MKMTKPIRPLRWLLAAGVLINLLRADPPGGPAGWTLTFEDQFNGTSLDSAKWSHGFGWGPNSSSFHETTRPQNATVANGVLSIKMEYDNGYKSGAVNSRNKFIQKYGYWEARIKLPGATAGLLPAFWAKFNNDQWPPELDILEVFGSNRAAQFTVHWSDSTSSHRQSGGSWDGGDLSTAYHVFGCEWDQNYVRWYVDGVLRRTYERPAADGFLNQWNSVSDGIYMMLNIHAANFSWTGGTLSQSALPRIMEVDWVRVWRKDAGGGGDTQAPTTPTNLTSTARTDTSVSLAWASSSDNVGVTGYDVYAGASLETTVPGTSAVVTGLEPATTYVFTVRARDAAGNVSAASNSVSVTTEAASGQTLYEAEVASHTGSVRSDIAGFTGLGFVDMPSTAGSITWTFNAPAGAGAYTLGVRYANGGTTGRPGSVTVNGGQSQSSAFGPTGAWTSWATTDFSGTLVAGTNTVVLSATNGANIDHLSVRVAPGGDTTPPSTPSGLAASAVTQAGFTLSWNAATDNVGVTAYDVYRDGVLAGSPATTSLAITGLAPGTTYAMTVRARDAAGNASPLSAPLAVTTASGFGPVTIQAEDSSVVRSNISLSTSNGGSVGSYADYPTTGGYCQWTVEVPSAGTYTLAFRYANGGGSARSGLLSINGTSAVTRSFAATSSWSTWTDHVVSVTLAAGTNTVRLSGPSSSPGMANVDSLTIRSP